MKRQELVGFFCEFWGVKEANVTDSLPLDDKTLNNRSSLRFYQFIAAVESNFDIQVEDINKLRTFGDILKNAKKDENIMP